MKLIIEQVENVEYLFEGAGAGKQYFIEGIFMQGEKPNKNRRKYPRQVLANECARYIKECVDQNRAFGELGHPDTPTINLDRASHMIKSLKEDGDNYIGKAKIMDTPHGRIVKTLIDEGAKLGVSSRGLGSLKLVEGINIVQPDYRLATAGDIVADPSAHEAFVQGLMEGKSWVIDPLTGDYKVIEELQEEIKNAKRREIEATSLRVFEQFLNKI